MRAPGPELRYAALALRAAAGDGPGTLAGVAVRYGDLAELPGWRERIAPGAFGELRGLDVIANVQHDRARPLARTEGGGLALADSARELAITVELPATRDGEDVATLFRLGVLRGVSVEMRVEREDWEGDLRTVRAAKLRGLALVDRPAYGASRAALAERARAEVEAASRPPAPAWRPWEW